MSEGGKDIRFGFKRNGRTKSGVGINNGQDIPVSFVRHGCDGSDQVKVKLFERF